MSIHTIYKHRVVLLAMLLGVLVSCTGNVTYHHYEKIADEGWDVRDTVSFGLDTIRQAGTYTSSLCVRATALYPYRNLSVMVYQTVYHKKEIQQADSVGRSIASLPQKKYTKGRTIVYTMPLEIKQKNGVATGQGVTYYTYEYPYATTDLQKGDSIAIVVRHHMRREILPCITDIGIKLTINN